MQPTTKSPAAGSRQISIFDTFCIGVNAIIGSGIFIFPWLLAQKVGPASIVAFAACGLVLVCVALCYAELGSMFRQNGGSYVYAKEAFGPFVGFGVGWISWVTSIFSWAAVANAVSPQLANYYSGFNQDYTIKVIALLLIVGFGLLNYYGIKLGAWTVNLFTIAKVIPLLIFVAVGLFYIHPEYYHPFWPTKSQLGEGQSLFGQFSAAMFLALWPLQGFEVTPVPSGESQNPQRAVPIAAVGSLLGAAFVYVLIQTVAVGVHPGLANVGPQALVEAARQFMGSAGGNLIMIGAVISMVGFNAGNALGCPRFLSAVAEDKHLPPGIAAPHPRYNTPSVAILLTTGLTACAALGLSFKSLVNLANLAVILQYVSTCAAVIWLRRARPNAERLFKIPFGIPIAIAGCAVSLWLIKEVEPGEFLLAIAVLDLGLLITAVYRQRITQAFVSTGFLAGGVVGYLLRPLEPLGAQLSFTTVITRGSALTGEEAKLISLAQASFNFIVAGAIIGAAIAFLQRSRISSK